MSAGLGTDLRARRARYPARRRLRGRHQLVRAPGGDGARDVPAPVALGSGAGAKSRPRASSASGAAASGLFNHLGAG